MHPVWAALPGAVLGVALQLQQQGLWPVAAYLGVLAAGSACACLTVWARGRRRILPFGAALLAGALVAGGSTGLRATSHQARALAPGLEGVDLVVTGEIAAMPQRGPDSDRFEFAVESATRDGQAVPLPPRLLLSDFRGQGAGRAWRAGDGWRLTVRLRRPHGASNPHGFDRERWLWEHGIGATGYLRDGPRDSAPAYLGPRGRHPVEAARQWVSERIHARVSDPRSAGVLAALVVGDQAAIDRDLPQSTR
jgi:competence protein ComEC